MSTIHLTPEEKRALKRAKQEANMRQRSKLYRSMIARRTARQNAKKAALTRAENNKIVVDPPPLDLLEMFGAAQTALPETVRPTVDIPLDPRIPENIPDDQFIEDISEQPDFLETMGENIEDVRVARFLKLIGEVENRSMTWCARSCGLTNKDMARIWRDSKLTRAFFRIVNRMPEIADKVADDAIGRKKACPRCDGMKRVDIPDSMREFFNGETTAICPNCDGRGVVVNIGSAVDKQLIWERVGWSKQKTGVNVNVNMSDHSVDATISEMDGLENDLGTVLEHQA